MSITSSSANAQHLEKRKIDYPRSRKCIYFLTIYFFLFPFFLFLFFFLDFRTNFDGNGEKYFPLFHIKNKFSNARIRYTVLIRVRVLQLFLLLHGYIMLHKENKCISFRNTKSDIDRIDYLYYNILKNVSS